MNRGFSPPSSPRTAGQMRSEDKATQTRSATLKRMVKLLLGNSSSLEQFFDRLAAGQNADGAAGIIKILLFRVDAEMVVDGRQNVERRLGVVPRKCPVAVGRPDHAAPLHLSAREGGA